jgi:predicted HTH transcriptional regulator
MLKKLLAALAEDETVTPEELARRTGLGREMVAQALRDLAARGYLEPVENPTGDCASACNSCDLLANCRVRMWRLAKP